MRVEPSYKLTGRLLCGVALSLLACRDFDAQSEGPAPDLGSAGARPEPDGSTNGGSTGLLPVTTGGSAAAGPASGGTAAASPGKDGAGAGMGGASGDLEARAPDDFGERLALWLKAEPESCATDDDQEISSWRDLSSYKNDAHQLEPWRRPEFLKQGANQRPAVLFKGSRRLSTLVVPDHSSLHFEKRDFAYVIVARLLNDPMPQFDIHGELSYAGYGTILSKVHPETHKGISVYANFMGDWPMAPATTRFAVKLDVSGGVVQSSNDNVNDGVIRVYTARRLANGDVELRINRRSENKLKNSDQPNVSAVGTPLVIGGTEKQPFEGEISELVVISGGIEDDELEGLEKGLMGKHAVVP
jgi:hypothetical protein